MRRDKRTLEGHSQEPGNDLQLLYDDNQWPCRHTLLEGGLEGRGITTEQQLSMEETCLLPHLPCLLKSTLCGQSCWYLVLCLSRCQIIMLVSLVLLFQLRSLLLGCLFLLLQTSLVYPLPWCGGQSYVQFMYRKDMPLEHQGWLLGYMPNKPIWSEPRLPADGQRAKMVTMYGRCATTFNGS